MKNRVLSNKNKTLLKLGSALSVILLAASFTQQFYPAQLLPVSTVLAATSSNGQVTLTWDASTDEPGGSGLAGYYVYRVTGSNPPPSTANPVATVAPSSGPTVSWGQGGLAAGTYTYTVKAFDAASPKPNISGPSNAATVTIKAPTRTADLNNDGKINVTDLSILLRLYGTNDPTADINGNGTVDVGDLSILLRTYGG